MRNYLVLLPNRSSHIVRARSAEEAALEACNSCSVSELRFGASLGVVQVADIQTIKIQYDNPNGSMQNLGLANVVKRFKKARYDI